MTKPANRAIPFAAMAQVQPPPRRDGVMQGSFLSFTYRMLNGLAEHGMARAVIRVHSDEICQMREGREGFALLLAEEKGPIRKFELFRANRSGIGPWSVREYAASALLWRHARLDDTGLALLGHALVYDERFSPRPQMTEADILTFGETA